MEQPAEQQNTQEEIQELEDRLRELKSRDQGKAPPSPYAVPGAIIVAGLIIAGAVMYVSNSPTSVGNQGGTAQAVQGGGSRVLNNVRPVSAEDHVLGSLDAPVKIVEYSDLECPFCKRFHLTMQKIINEYGRDGRVAWVYRHFPLDQLHRKSKNEAAATECAASMGGNDAFWAYVNRLFEVTPSNDGLDPTELPRIAEFVGLDRTAFEACLADGTFADHVEEDYQNAISSGGTGTPYSVILSSNGKAAPLSGAQPYERVKAMVETALAAQ